MFMAKKRRICILFTCLWCSIAFTSLRAQPVTDVTKLDPISQLNNASIQVVDLMKNRVDVPRLLDLLPKLSPFALTQLDSVDVYEAYPDSVHVVVFNHNSTHFTSNAYCICYENGVKLRILLAPDIRQHPQPLKYHYDPKKFEYTIRVKGDVSLPLPQKTVPGKRYIIDKDYNVTPKLSPPVPRSAPATKK